MSGNVFRSTHLPGTIYQCPVCSKWFEAGDPNVQCLVAHPNDSCCHYMDKEIK